MSYAKLTLLLERPYLRKQTVKTYPKLDLHISKHIEESPKSIPFNRESLRIAVDSKNPVILLISSHGRLDFINSKIPTFRVPKGMHIQRFDVSKPGISCYSTPKTEKSVYEQLRTPSKIDLIQQNILPPNWINLPVGNRFVYINKKTGLIKVLDHKINKRNAADYIEQGHRDPYYTIPLFYNTVTEVASIEKPLFEITEEDVLTEPIIKSIFTNHMEYMNQPCISEKCENDPEYEKFLGTEFSWDEWHENEPIRDKLYNIKSNSGIFIINERYSNAFNFIPPNHHRSIKFSEIIDYLYTVGCKNVLVVDESCNSINATQEQIDEYLRENPHLGGKKTRRSKRY